MMEVKQIEKERWCYESAIAAGCEEHFLQAFQRRLSRYPIRQTECFMWAWENERTEEHYRRICQWRIWLTVLLSEAKERKNAKEWASALELLKMVQNAYDKNQEYALLTYEELYDGYKKAFQNQSEREVKTMVGEYVKYRTSRL